MSELVTVYPSKPPVKGGYSNPGAILYRGVYFSVTLRSVAVKTDEGKDKVLVGTMKTAISMMDDIVEAHNAGLVVLNDEVLYREPEDQRPADESRKTYEAPDQAPPRQQSAGDGSTPQVKTFVCVKVDKERENGKTYLRFFMKNGKYPAVRIRPDEKMWDKACQQMQGLTNIDWSNAELGTSVNCDLVLGYTESGQKKSGNPYWNFYGIRAKQGE